MPPKPKLHNKNGKVKSFPKPLQVNPQPSTSTEETSVEDNEQKFGVELLWCVHQLENMLENKNINPKQAEELTKVIKILKNNSQPVVRKRQLMRQHFGDYRAKMAAEEKKLKKAGNKMTIESVTPSTSKSTFIRKSATLSMGDNSFRFNFAHPSNSQDTGDASESTNVSQVKQESTSNGSESAHINSATNISNGIRKLNFGSDSFKFNFDVK